MKEFLRLCFSSNQFSGKLIIQSIKTESENQMAKAIFDGDCPKDISLSMLPYQKCYSICEFVS